jgi:DNA-directed RNA polymerase specialized sigma24 family protein
MVANPETLKRQEAVQRLCAQSAVACRIAIRSGGSVQDAEDAVQQACLIALRELPAGLSPEEERLCSSRS